MTGSRVLVVEDDAPLAATLERLLVAEGHEVEVTGDGLAAARVAWRGSRQLSLTATEFDLLEYLLRHPRQVLSREQLLASVWRDEPDNDNVVAVYIGYVRQKVEEDGEPRLVHTVRGAGY